MAEVWQRPRAALSDHLADVTIRDGGGSARYGRPCRRTLPRTLHPPSRGRERRPGGSGPIWQEELGEGDNRPPASEALAALLLLGLLRSGFPNSRHVASEAELAVGAGSSARTVPGVGCRAGEVRELAEGTRLVDEPPMRWGTKPNKHIRGTLSTPDPRALRHVPMPVAGIPVGRLWWRRPTDRGTTGSRSTGTTQCWAERDACCPGLGAREKGRLNKAPECAHHADPPSARTRSPAVDMPESRGVHRTGPNRWADGRLHWSWGGRRPPARKRSRRALPLRNRRRTDADSRALD